MISDGGKSEEHDRSYKISEINEVFTEEYLSEKGFVLNNFVGTLQLNRLLDLDALYSDLENSEYSPESYPSMIYRPFGSKRSISVLTPSSGKLVIVGAKSQQELREGAEVFLKELKNLGIEVKISADNIIIQNIVANYDLNAELDLSVVALELDLENIEYEPEQFPGLIYRTKHNTTVLVFGSGKSVITGANTYEEIIDSRDEVVRKLRDIGVKRV